MLPLPNLDDRTFEQLVKEARALIPEIFPEWTDENTHDPGMTLLELLAWLIETQQYQLDRLTDQHERKFLKLLGIAPRDRLPALTSISFSGTDQPVYVPLGTRIRAGEFPFETLRPVAVVPDGGRTVTVYTASGAREIPNEFESGNAPFYPFGPDGDPDSRTVLRFEQPLPRALPLSLWLGLADEPNRRIPARYPDFLPSAQLEWTFWQPDASGAGGEWIPVEMERDETYGLHQSGPVLFSLPAGAEAIHRLSVRIVEGSYADPPMIRRIVWNEVFAQQCRTWCITERFDAPDTTTSANSNHEVELMHALFQLGVVRIQFQRPDGGWRDVEESAYSVTIRGSRAFLSFRPDVRLPEGKRTIRAIAMEPEWLDRFVCGTGTGISGQTCGLPGQPLLPQDCRIQIAWIPDGEAEAVWYDWERVADFDGSFPDSFHYVIQEEEGVIRFSDGRYGAVPPAAEFPNIRIIGYRTGGGLAGNIKQGVLRQAEFPRPLRVAQLYPAYGGTEAESMREAMNRARMEVFEPESGVTAEDIEHLAMEIPGLRLARVKALPGFSGGEFDADSDRDPRHLSVVVVPYSRNPRPQPDQAMMETVRRHLQPYRMLTTALHVIAPEYIGVTVGAVIVVDPRYEGREQEVRERLNDWLQPYAYGSKSGKSGWRFGHPVYKSDVYEVIQRMPGVQYIQELWLTADGRNARREESGDIRLPPNGLVVSGSHEIEFILSNR